MTPIILMADVAVLIVCVFTMISAYRILLKVTLTKFQELAEQAAYLEESLGNCAKRILRLEAFLTRDLIRGGPLTDVLLEGDNSEEEEKFNE